MIVSPVVLSWQFTVLPRRLLDAFGLAVCCYFEELSWLVLPRSSMLLTPSFLFNTLQPSLTRFFLPFYLRPYLSTVGTGSLVKAGIHLSKKPTALTKQRDAAWAGFMNVTGCVNIQTQPIITLFKPARTTLKMLLWPVSGADSARRQSPYYRIM